jgi:hypothetical protein
VRIDRARVCIQPVAIGALPRVPLIRVLHERRISVEVLHRLEKILDYQ